MPTVLPTLICHRGVGTRAFVNRRVVVQVVAETIDHKPYDAPERARIEKAGGVVSMKRVDGDLAVVSTKRLTHLWLFPLSPLLVSTLVPMLESMLVSMLMMLLSSLLLLPMLVWVLLSLSAVAWTTDGLLDGGGDDLALAGTMAE